VVVIVKGPPAPAAVTLTIAVDVVMPEALVADSVYVVVDVGLTLVEPFADTEVNVPGVTATLAAPVVTQLSVLPEPDLMLAGLAVKDVTAGAEPVCGLVVDGSGLLVEPPQPVAPADTKRARAAARSPSPVRTELTFFRLAVEVGERKRNPLGAIRFIVIARLGPSQVVMMESRNASRI
jgi:hypothetical protein